MVQLAAPFWALRCVASTSRISWAVTRASRRSYQSLQDPESLQCRPRLHLRPLQGTRGFNAASPRQAFSSSAFRRDDKSSPTKQESQTPYARLSTVLRALPGPIDWGVAYGSGVISQANSSSSVPKLVDFLISTPDPVAFHTSNIEKYPSHYPFYARWAGGSAVAGWQDRWGAGVWYVTNVHLCGLYGVISISRLRTDLEAWDTLYVAGRLQKPVLPLRVPRSLEEALTANHRAALSLALLQLGGEFTEMQLWEEIAGISYSGDPRMSVPGAENPMKVKNIVRGPGVRDGFRDMYGGLLREAGGGGVRAVRKGREEEKSDWTWWNEQEEGTFTQPADSGYRISLFQNLPIHLQTSVVKELASGGGGGGGEKKDLAKIINDPRFKEVLQSKVGTIIRRPALTQSLKGLFTAGPVKSFWYGLAKVQKWWAGRSKPS